VRETRRVEGKEKGKEIERERGKKQGQGANRDYHSFPA